MIYYYTKDTSSGLIYVTIAFLVYVIYLFTDSVLNLNKKTYTDTKTKLYNSARWDEYIKMNASDNAPLGIMMFDINGLKYANDTYGHKAGDKIIVKFSEILKNTFDESDFVCRWGGDEFAVIVKNADAEKMEGYIHSLINAADEYNSTGVKPQLHFACGYVMSTEFPGMSGCELLEKADERMYGDKQEWYKKRIKLINKNA
ncbi:MAG: GGDEF domain-containing protein [Acutalibacteraceae bacterium]|nr:GGDEF domain-containing protein [Acutalibacteraceae bacterium]